MSILNPKLPTGKHATHARAVLALLLRGGKVDQYDYHAATGYPTTDYRTRISDLKNLCNWHIDRAYHIGTDHNGQPQRCKHYWINREWLRQQFENDPVFKVRCRVLMDQGV